jgi:integrase
MPQAQMMTLHEKLQLGVKSIDLEKQGKFEEAKRVSRQIPLAPYLAKFLKDHLGTDALLLGGWNLTEAEAEYGSDWLSK